MIISKILQTQMGMDVLYIQIYCKTRVSNYETFENEAKILVIRQKLMQQIVKVKWLLQIMKIWVIL